MLSDNQFLLTVLGDGRWHSHEEILQRSLRERGCGLTVHSRAADLRKQGYVVDCHVRSERGQRKASFYRLVAASSAVEAAA